MENSNDISEEKFWKDAIKKHKNAFIVLIIAAICAIIGALLVLFWIIEVNPFVDARTYGFDTWTLSYIFGFFILLFLAEILYVGIPAGLFFGIGGYLWWKRLPEEEKREFKEREKKGTHRKRDYGGGGGFSFFMFLFYCLYILIDGNFETPLGNRPWSYWVYSWFLTVMWILIIFGIPAVIILIIVYFTYWRKK